MINRLALGERVREWGLSEEVVEKDYVLGWVLSAIGRHPVLGAKWVFKGGTCLKKCYIETYRFSEDLDFTVVPHGPIRADDLAPILSEMLPRLTDESGIDFSRREPLLKTHASGNYTEGRIYYVGPRGSPNPSAIRLDLTSSEPVVRPTELRAIGHAYPDALPDPATVQCYGFEEVFAEKLRAMSERGRPRDLYDIVNLFRREDLRGDPEDIRSILEEKCRTKGVPFPSIESILAGENRAELEAEWSNMLAHQLPALPPLPDFVEELPRIFDWLNEVAEEEVLQPVAAVGKTEDATWSPPSTVGIWGLGVPVETIRFAAANHLCVELGYDGGLRVIEPYSLRRTRDGNYVLHAVRSDNREHRSYRLDRIQSVRATNQSFVPVYQIEFAATGPISAPPGYSLAPSRPTRPRRRRAGTGVEYVIECPWCHKKFRRSSMRNTRLREHRGGQNYRCPGSGQSGHFVGAR